MQTVTAEFTLTLDDLKEAFRANGMLHVSFWSFGWFITLGLVLAFSGRAEWLVPSIVKRSPFGVLAQLAAALGPLGFTFAIAWAALFRILRNLKRPRPMSRALAWGGWTAAVALAALHVVAARAMAAPAAEAGTNTLPAATIGNLLPVAAWAGFYTLLGLGMLAFSRSSTRRIWIADVTLHRPKRSEAGPNGYTETDALSRREENWLALIEWRETANLFLLYIGRAKFYVVPKRGFAVSEDVNTFRAMLRDNVSDQSHAFPVAPAKAVPPPLPVPAVRG